MPRLFALLLILFLSPAQAGQVYTLSVVPQVTPVLTGQRWAPLVAYLERETGISMQLRQMNGFAKFEADFLAGVPDFVFLNSWHAIMARKASGYTPLVRSGDPLQGILVVERNGPIRNLADLNGKTLAFPAPNAFGSSLYMRALLTDKERIAFTPVYAGTHQNVYRHVLLGEAAAGAGIAATLQQESASVQSRLKVIYTTPGVAALPLAAHPRVPPDVRQRVIDALQKLGRDPAGRKLLASIELGNIQVADFERDYAPLEKMNLGGYALAAAEK